MPRAEQQEAGEAAIGVLTTGQWTDLINTPESKAFVEKYQKKMGRIPGPWDEQQYTATQAVLRSIEFVGDDLSYKALIDAYHKISISSPRGNVSFAPGGWLKSPQYVFEYIKVEGGRITLKPIEKYDFYHPEKITWSYSDWRKRQ
jgi:ABC-type branched-subunit amino acid transport system substrate-binding protein